MAITRRSVIVKAISKEESTPVHEIQSNEVQTQNQNTQPDQAINNEAASDYEQFREQRIKENRERLQKLGIVDLSLKLKAMGPNKRTPRNQSERKTPLKSPALLSSEPRRRSSRLQNAPPVSYCEPKEVKPRKNGDVVLEEGAKPEVYTEEHEKLLGNTEMEWTLFVDGYVDGVRIYDPVNGKTCHQCRQKTLGLRTRCSKCSLVQGQFCGDCLYVRYGEHVVEANQNPNWICPPCRGICNCSLCRQAKGWLPTGAISRRVSNMGYKSVAHFLIMTKRALPDSDNGVDCPQSAKRALPFEGMEVPSDDGSGQELNLDDKAEVVKTEINEQSGNEVDSVGEPKPDLEAEGGRQTRKRSKKKDVPEGEDKVGTNGSAEDEPASNMKSSNASASNADSIGRRLRSRNRT